MSVLKSLFLLMVVACYSLVQSYPTESGSSNGKPNLHNVSHSNVAASKLFKGSRSISSHDRSFAGKRQGSVGCTTTTKHHYELVGDGNPHQNYRIGQLEDTVISCPGTLTPGASHTFAWSASIGASPVAKDFEFAAFDFPVTEEETKHMTDHFECPAGATEICAMHYMAVTAVTVNFYATSSTCGATDTMLVGTGTVFLPNANGVGSTVRGGANFGDRNIIQCRGKVQREIDFNCGPKGGPEWFETNEVGPWGEEYIRLLDPSACPVPIEALIF